MAVYTYKALDRESGEIHQDQIEGSNTTAVAAVVKMVQAAGDVRGRRAVIAVSIFFATVSGPPPSFAVGPV